MRRLLPEPGDDIEVSEAYAAPLGAHTDRPWVGLCMVASLDGSTVVDGRSGALSSPTDSAVLLQLRTIADAIIVGAGTVRGEGYGAARKAGQRIGVVTLSGDLDYSSPLFESGTGFVITSVEGPSVPVPGIDVLRAGHGSVDLLEAIRRLPEVCGPCAFVQAEGGAALNGALVDADIVDEINLTTSPGVVGGHGPRLSSGAAEHVHRFALEQLAVDEESFLFARWSRRRVGD
jgi:riboflavin biosynthesis pyrimidine reductase